MKRDPVQERRSELEAARESPGSRESLEILRRGLNDRVQVVVARAAELVGELELRELLPELVSAFERFLESPQKDKGCLAKTAIMEVLTRLEHDEADVFLKGIRHVQMEPVWGGQEDTAAWLRGLSGIGLTGCGHPEVDPALVDLLADEEKLARVGAVRALGGLGRSEGALLIRLRLLSRDPEIEVMAEGFRAILALEPPKEGCAFVGRFLADPDAAVAEAAALSLGESRLENAFSVLRDARASARESSFRRALLVAMALLRNRVATDHLVGLIEADSPDSSAALQALGPFLYSGELRERVRRAIDAAGNPRLKAALEEILLES